MSSDPPIDNADPVVEYEILLASCLDDMSRQVANPTVEFRQRITGEAAKVILDQRSEIEHLQQQVKAEQQWAAYLRSCAFSNEIPSSRGEFDANQQYLRMIKENQSGTQSTKPGTSPEPEA